MISVENYIHKIGKKKPCNEFWKVFQAISETLIVGLTKIIQEKQFNSYILAADKEKREEYSSKLKERIESLQEDEISWENVANHITEAAKEVVGFRTSNKNNRQNNSGVQKLSEEQKEIRLQISTCKDTEKRKELKLKRNRIIMHKIKTMLEADKEIELNHKIDDIEKNKRQH